MDTYYFSGTGNSYFVAKTISEQSKTNPIPITNKTPKPTNNTICIVFPSYLAASTGTPLIVQEFVKTIKNINTKTIYIVCTCGGYELMNAIPSLHKLEKTIKKTGGKVKGKYSLRMPMNNQNYDHIIVPIEKNIEIINTNAKQKAEKIAFLINNNQKTKHNTLKTMFYYLMTPLFKLISIYIKHEMRIQAQEPKHTTKTVKELIPLTDKSIQIKDTCKGCGICTKVCPVDNIQIINGKPIFKHTCEMCFACDEWCPSSSILHWGRTKGGKYHHKDVTIKNFLI